MFVLPSAQGGQQEASRRTLGLESWAAVHSNAPRVLGAEPGFSGKAAGAILLAPDVSELEYVSLFIPSSPPKSGRLRKSDHAHSPAHSFPLTATK